MEPNNAEPSYKQQFHVFLEVFCVKAHVCQFFVVCERKVVNLIRYAKAR